MRNIPERATADASTPDRLLDAARSSIMSVGWRRTTLTEVARRAGLSRMTVYRTYPDMDALFGDLMTREWSGVVAEVAALQEQEGGWPERIASGVATIVGAFRDNDLFRRMVDVDPEWLLPYLLDRRGRSQDVVLDLLAVRIAQAQADGQVRDGDPALLARGIVLAAHGFVISGHTMTDDDVAQAALDEELAEMVARYLAP